MRAAAGAYRDQQGAAGLALAVILAGLAITGMLFLPTLVSKTSQRRNASEEAVLARLERNFRAYVRLNQTIPGTTTWITAISSVSSLNATQVSCVFPDFPTDTTVQRVFVVDDFLGGGSPLLPYTQSTNGLTGSNTNLLNSRARAMIVSCTKRGLALPVSSGFISQATFDAIWNWTYDPAAKSPPSGWSSAWTGKGDFLHVKPIYLPGLFSKITLDTVRFGTGPSNITTTIASSATDYYFLNGTRMTMGQTNGTLKQVYLVTRDNFFNFPAGQSALPALWYKFSEVSGSTAENSGTYGSTWDGTYSSGLSKTLAGPRPPSYPNYAANNTCVTFQQDNSKVSTNQKLTNALSAFTIAAWVTLDYWEDTSYTFVGVNGALELETYKVGANHFVRLYTKNGGSAAASYPYPSSEWHHVAGVGDGAQVSLYIDGTRVASTATTLANYAYDSGGTFKIGANPLFNGAADEVVFYATALSAAEIGALSTGALPLP